MYTVAEIVLRKGQEFSQQFLSLEIAEGFFSSGESTAQLW